MRQEHLTDLFVVPDYDTGRVSASFTSPAGASRCAWEIVDPAGTCVTGGSMKLSPRRVARIETVLKRFEPWHVHSPRLYMLRMTLTRDGDAVSIETPFGIRKLRATPEGVFVNNEPFYVRGCIRGIPAHDHPNLANLPIDAFHTKSIQAAREYGFNFVRFHSHVPSEEFFREADRLGLFVHVEIVNREAGSREDHPLFARTVLPDEQHLRRVVRKIRNHPSLMVYCLGNEIWHPGLNPEVKRLAGIIRKLDPTRLFVDSSAHGEFDRESVDVDVQHMGYFFPFGAHHDMFENTYALRYYGSCSGQELVQENPAQPAPWRIERAITLRRPVLGHEVGHYCAWRDLDALAKKFDAARTPKPWWIDELKALIKKKGLEPDVKRCIEASRRFQFISWKLCLEAIRRSSALNGFHFLQLADTDRYENANGVVDCFDEKKGVPVKPFLQFNGDTVLLADLPRRTFFEGECISIPIMLSHFSPTLRGTAQFRFTLSGTEDQTVFAKGSLKDVSLDKPGLNEICRLEVAMPQIAKPQALRLECSLKPFDVNNGWNLWVYPDRPEKLRSRPVLLALDDIHPEARYPQLLDQSAKEPSERLLVTNRFSQRVFRHLERGGDVFMMYRVPETRDRRDPDAPRETYWLPATWDRCKCVIWDRGHNNGAFVRPSTALAGFPNDGYLDLQFWSLVDDADKICLDDFPADFVPIIQGVDKANRDRFDTLTYRLAELQPEWTLRRFAYLVELAVGEGRLLVSGFNFTGLDRRVPETCAMFESLMRYVASKRFRPEARMTVAALRRYLLAKGKGPRTRERKMTQYWQLDEEPLESEQYWKDAEAYIEGRRIRR